MQYYLLIVEKRSSSHDQLVLQQQQSQQNPSYNQTTQVNDEFAKWIIEPLVICALDPTAFLRKELIEVCFYCVQDIIENIDIIDLTTIDYF